MPRKSLLEVSDLSITFSGVKAADRAELTVYEDEVVAIIGPNGAGKTTLLNLCTGYIRPNAGRISFEGKDITGLPPRAITRLGVARAFQIPQLFADRTLRENLLLSVAAREGIWDVWRPLARPGYQQMVDDILALVKLEDAAERAVSELPEGIRKLTDIAIALALRPRLLLLDEPTSGVSNEEKFAIMDTLVGALRARKISTLFVEHDMEIVKSHADRVIVWSTGKVVTQGTPAEILEDPYVKRDIVGIL